MARHGIARDTRLRTEEEREFELGAISRYRSLEDQVREKAKQKDYGPDTFQLTSKLLQRNPEYYTVWNIRRRCVISGFASRPSDGSYPSKASSSSSPTATPLPSSDAPLPASSAETPQSRDSQTAGRSGTTHDPDGGPGGKPSRQAWEDDLDVFKSELHFTVPLLLQFPKCYWIWNYRLWTLNQAIEWLPARVATKVWEEELGLVNKMLHKDRRNFHAWGYRRYVVDRLESSELAGKSLAEPELEYTAQMVRKDLSNFSAWHHRSQLIPRVLREREASDGDRRKFLESELALICEALNVGPEDQSLWFYHQFLISNLVESPGPQTIAPALTEDERKAYIRREIDEIKDLLEDYDNIKWIYEALIQYTLALSQLGDRVVPKDLTSWQRKLRDLDPQRSGRWTDLESQLAAI